jgi:uncharacterized membrane protein
MMELQERMDSTHLHLLLNHAPLMGAYFALGLIILGLIFRNSNLDRGGLVLLVASALLAIPVHLTGEPAESGVRGLPGVTREVIEEHEESALPTLIVFELAGAVALAGLVMYRKSPALPRGFALVVLAVTVVTTVMIARTAYLGGQIRHTEIRSGDTTGHVEQGERQDDD